MTASERISKLMSVDPEEPELTQTTLPLTMLNPSSLASVFDFCGCHRANAGKANNRRTRNTLFNRIGSRSSLVSTRLPHLVPHLLELLVVYHCRARSSLHTSLNAGTRHNVPNRLHRHAISPCPSNFVDPAEQFSSIDSSCGKPIVEFGSHPIRNWNCSNVATLADQINMRRVSQLDAWQREEHWAIGEA